MIFKELLPFHHWLLSALWTTTSRVSYEIELVDNQQVAFERVSYEVEESFGVVTLCVALNMMSLDEELVRSTVCGKS